MAFPYATLCVQGIKDGVTSEALQAQFEHYGRVRNVNITQNKNMKGAPDTRIAIVEFARRDDARKAMQGLNGRNVQGKCVMIRFAKTSPGMRTAAPPVRRGVPELIPQTASHEKLLAAKFRPADRSPSGSPSYSRSPKRGRGRSSPARKRRRSRSPKARTPPSRSRSASHWRPEEFSSPEPIRSRRSQPVRGGSKDRNKGERSRRDSRSRRSRTMVP